MVVIDDTLDMINNGYWNGTGDGKYSNKQTAKFFLKTTLHKSCISLVNCWLIDRIQGLIEPSHLLECRARNIAQ